MDGTIEKYFFFLGFNLLNTSTKCFTTIGNEGNVLQEEWLKEDQPKAYKCVTAVSQFYKKLNNFRTFKS